MYQDVLSPAPFLLSSMFHETFVLLLRTCLHHATRLQGCSCFSAYQDDSLSAHTSESLAHADIGLLKYDIGPVHCRYVQTTMLRRSLQFADRACRAAPRTVPRLTGTHPCALSTLSFPPNSSEDRRMPEHSILGLRWLRVHNLHAPMPLSGAAASLG